MSVGQLGKEEFDLQRPDQRPPRLDDNELIITARQAKINDGEVRSVRRIRTPTTFQYASRNSKPKSQML